MRTGIRLSNLREQDNPVTAEDLLQELRHDYLARKEVEVSPQILDWVQNWQKKLEEELHKKCLNWMSEAAVQLDRQHVEWEDKSSRCSRGTPGFFARIFAVRRSNRVQALHHEITQYDHTLQAEKAKCAEETTLTHNLCGILATLLRLPNACSDIGDKQQKKLLEMHIEKDLADILNQRIATTKQELATLEQQLGTLEGKAKENLKLHAQIEEQKGQRIFSHYAHASTDPERLLRSATAFQVRQSYAEVEKEILKTQEEILSQRSREQELRDEFVRLSGVVHEYEKEIGENQETSIANPLGAALRQETLDPDQHSGRICH